jgi:uncharacterized protein YegL
MFRLLGAVCATTLLVFTSLLSAQSLPGGNVSGNVSASATVPGAIQCSAPFSSNLALTGYDVQNPGFADIMLVLDESGSINGADFGREKTFALELINNLMTTPDGARVGLVQFSGDARLTMTLQNNKQSALNQVNNMYQRGGSTCIGCGIQLAHQRFFQQPRPQATQFMIVLTDGANNVNVNTFQSIVNQAKSTGVKMIAVGVGAVNQSEIEFIASDIPGVQTSFLINNFSELPSILNQLTAAISSPASTNVSVTLDIMPRFPVSNGTATAGSVSVTGSTVLWTLPALGASAQTLTLSHQHDGQGNGALQVFTGTYTDTQNHLVEIPTPSTVVNGCNTAPVANAGIDQSVDLVGATTATVTLDGSGSTDDGLIQPLSYTWTGPVSATGATPAVTLPAGVHTFVLTVADGEFSDSDSVTISVGDPTAPVITPAVSGTIVNGWYTSNVEVSFTTSDPETGIASSTGCSAVTISTDTAGETVTCTVTNGAGASSSESVTVRRDATAPSLTVPGPVTVEAAAASGAAATYAAPIAADALSGVAATSCTPASGSLFPLGTTTVACASTDNAGNTSTASFAVTVADTTAPEIGAVTPSVSSLWPVNHRMISVAINASAIDGVSAASCRITGVTSSEPDNGLGDGDTANDIVITGPLSVDLRAERSGNGPGRVYTIDVACTDAAGNTATSSTQVSVPKSNGK